MKLKTLLFTSFSFLYLYAVGQSYQLTVDSDAYVSLENSTSLNDGMIWDDSIYTIPIGFDFDFFDKSIDSLFIDTNGVIFDQSEEVSDIASGFFPFLNDLIDIGFESEVSASNISYLLEGEPGNQVLSLEWNNSGFYEDYYYGTANPNFISFQVRLYQSNGLIEYHYGESEVQDDVIFQYYGGGPVVGLLNNFNGNTELYDEFAVLNGDPTSPSIILWSGPIDFEYGPKLLDSTPAANTVYRFSQMDVSTNEIPGRSSQFSIYPNPVSTALNIVKKQDVEEIRSFSIYNNDGRLVKTITADFSNIIVSDLISGVYHLNILTDNGLAVKRFVKIDQ